MKKRKYWIISLAFALLWNMNQIAFLFLMSKEWLSSVYKAAKQISLLVTPNATSFNYWVSAPFCMTRAISFNEWQAGMTFAQLNIWQHSSLWRQILCEVELEFAYLEHRSFLTFFDGNVRQHSSDNFLLNGHRMSYRYENAFTCTYCFIDSWVRGPLYNYLAFHSKSALCYAFSNSGVTFIRKLTSCAISYVLLRCITSVVFVRILGALDTWEQLFCIKRFSSVWFTWSEQLLTNVWLICSSTRRVTDCYEGSSWKQDHMAARKSKTCLCQLDLLYAGVI